MKPQVLTRMMHRVQLNGVQKKLNGVQKLKGVVGVKTIFYTAYIQHVFFISFLYALYI